jgi:hypothetical protein
MVPILLVMLASRRKVWWGIGYLGMAALAILLVKLTTGTETEAWGGPPLGNPDLFGSVTRRAASLRVSLPEGLGCEPRVLDERHAGLTIRLRRRRQGIAQEAGFRFWDW